MTCHDLSSNATLLNWKIFHDIWFSSGLFKIWPKNNRSFFKIMSFMSSNVMKNISILVPFSLIWNHMMIFGDISWHTIIFGDISWQKLWYIMTFHKWLHLIRRGKHQSAPRVYLSILQILLGKERKRSFEISFLQRDIVKHPLKECHEFDTKERSLFLSWWIFYGHSLQDL